MDLPPDRSGVRRADRISGAERIVHHRAGFVDDGIKVSLVSRAPGRQPEAVRASWVLAGMRISLMSRAERKPVTPSYAYSGFSSMTLFAQPGLQPANGPAFPGCPSCRAAKETDR
jgi:hypothetical protein